MGLTRPTAAQIDSTAEVITDPISMLNNKSTKANVDVGFLINRDGGISSNVAVFWQESNQQFVFALTSSNAVSRFSNIVVTSNANVVTGNVFAAGYFYSNGTAFTGGGNADYIFSGASNVRVTASYVNVAVNGSNIAAFNTSGLTIGTVNLSGNLLATAGLFNALTVNGLINSSGNVMVGGNLFVGGGFANIFSPSISTDSALQIVGNVARGGASYHDFLRVTSTASGATNVNKHFRLDGTGNLQIINSAYSSTILSLTDSGILTDGKGDVRGAPQNSQSGAYPLVVGDAGKHISITTGGVTVNANIFSIGDMVTVYNNSGSSQNITQGTSVTLRLAGTATTGTRALAQYGVATLLCVTGGATPTFACTGAGLT